MRVPRKILLILLGCVLGLIALEVVLQVAAYVIWSRRGTQPVAGGDGDRVLCVGDSFTWGLGASDPANAYPRVLERQLAERGIAARVVNGGWPGNSSVDVLTPLQRRLRDYHPRLVLVLVGYNDFWSSGHPAPEDPDAFPFELRTLRLLRLLYAALTGSPRDDVDPDRPGAVEQAPVLGAWHDPNGVWIEFRPDGQVETPAGFLQSLWVWDAGRLWLTSREGGERQALDARVDGDSLTLAGGPFPAPVTFARGLPERTDYERGLRAERDGRRGDAVRLYRAAVAAGGAEADRARRALVRMLAAGGEQAAAREVAEPLVAAWEAQRTSALGWLAIDALLDLGDVAAALRIAAGFLDAGLDQDRVAELLIRRGAELADREFLIAALERALERDGLAPARRATLAGVLASLAPDDVDRRLRAMVDLLLVDPDNPVFFGALSWDRERYPRDAFVRAVDATTSDPARRAALIATYDRAAAGDDRTADALAGNLAQIVRRCREAGAEPILLTYPIERAQVAAAVRQVAAALQVEVIDLLAEFRARCDPAACAKLFTLDGHCNDDGYRLVGRIVAERIAPRLR
ncbi:MAG: SGNH/GDSL hydrolase family protein [Planctomycetes bacterium]|nr:SGNH/GDSL hydrolase family protein [Planctomycetota bacterium]